MGQLAIGRIESFSGQRPAAAALDVQREEWHEMRAASWREAQSDWKVQFGCLTALFGLVGLLVGVGLALDDLPSYHVGLEDVLEVVAGVVPWTSGGLLAGALLGVVVAGGNYLAARAAVQQRTPGEVALAREEFFVNGQYFSGALGSPSSRASTSRRTTETGQSVLTIVTQHPWRTRGSGGHVGDPGPAAAPRRRAAGCAADGGPAGGMKGALDKVWEGRSLRMSGAMVPGL